MLCVNYGGSNSLRYRESRAHVESGGRAHREQVSRRQDCLVEVNASHQRRQEAGDDLAVVLGEFEVV